MILDPWQSGQPGKGYMDLANRKVVAWHADSGYHDNVLKDHGYKGYNDPNVSTFAINSNGGVFHYPLMNPETGKYGKPPLWARKVIEKHVGGQPAPATPTWEFT